MTSDFKLYYTLDQRKDEHERIMRKHPGRIPIICEKSKHADCPEIDKKKYLIPSDLNIGQFILVIRKRMKLEPEKALFIFINGTLPPISALLSQIYEEHKDEDGFLYVTYAGESTFG